MKPTDTHIADAPSLAEAKHYIDQLTFDNQIRKIVREDGWMDQHAQAVAQLYRNFLYLTRKYRLMYRLPPTKEIDYFWHQHILDTQQYRQDSQAIFGEYLDHYPYFGMDDVSNLDDLNQAFERLCELHEEEFGYALYAVRPFWAKCWGVLKCCVKRRPKGR